MKKNLNAVRPLNQYGLLSSQKFATLSETALNKVLLYKLKIVKNCSKVKLIQIKKCTIVKYFGFFTNHTKVKSAVKGFALNRVFQVLLQSFFMGGGISHQPKNHLFLHWCHYKIIPYHLYLQNYAHLSVAHLYYITPMKN